MKYMYQLAVILLFSGIGELLHALIPGPIPASIYGFVLLLICLCLKIVKLEMVEEAADYIISLLPLILTPLSVGLMNAGDALKAMLIPTFVISIVTTVVCMGLTAKVTQVVIKRRKKP